MNEVLPIGLGGWLFIGFYLASLLIVGYIGRRARIENSLRDFYLAGQGFGFFVLFFTLFATQYSGNTFFAFTGATYRLGYLWILSLHFMTAVVVCYLIFAPALYRRAKQRNYLTPADYVADRFNHRALTLLVSIVMIVALGNFLLAQLMAMGRAMQGLAQMDSDRAYDYGVITLALIMVIYGTMGGLRAVAWTDAIQGIILTIGFAVLAFLLFDRYGSLSQATQIIQAMDLKEGTHKAITPTAADFRVWLSYILTAGFAVCLYPQAIQRIYAARSAATLRRSLAVMAFMPLPTMIIALIAGIMAMAYIPGLQGAATDQVFGRVLGEIQSYSTLGHALVVVIIAAVLAAMMSTADSALLSISSMFTKDIYASWLNPRASEAHLTAIGKTCSWLLIGALVMLAIALKDHTSLVRLMDRKLDLLIQLVPSFMLSIRWAGLRARPTFYGLLCGLTVALTLVFGGFEFVQGGKVWGFHPGLIGLIANLLVAWLGSRFTRIH